LKLKVEKKEKIYMKTIENLIKTCCAIQEILKKIHHRAYALQFVNSETLDLNYLMIETENKENSTERYLHISFNKGPE